LGSNERTIGLDFDLGVRPYHFPSRTHQVPHTKPPNAVDQEFGRNRDFESLIAYNPGAQVAKPQLKSFSS
jgi:hypothetical protein